MTRLRACCSACGWHGTATTGWVPYELATRMVPAEVCRDPRRRRARGARIQVRVRLRELRCPKCSETALERAADPASVAATLARAEGKVRSL